MNQAEVLIFFRCHFCMATKHQFTKKKNSNKKCEILKWSSNEWEGAGTDSEWDGTNGKWAHHWLQSTNHVNWLAFIVFNAKWMHCENVTRTSVCARVGNFSVHLNYPNDLNYSNVDRISCFCSSWEAAAQNHLKIKIETLHQCMRKRVATAKPTPIRSNI